MPWPTDYATGEAVNSHANVEAFRRAIFERVKAVSGATRWPQPNNSSWAGGGEGTIEALARVASGDFIGDFKLTDSTKTWRITDDDHIDAARWVNWTDPDVSENQLPRDYDIILNCDDPDITRHVHLNITGQPTADTHSVYVSPPLNWVTAGWIESVEWLVGKPYAIIKRNGIWWGERWPNQPNDEELWVGTGDASTVVRCSPVDEDDNPISWLPGQFAGKVFRQAGQPDYVIRDNGIHYLVVEWISAVPAGVFTVVDGSTVLATDTITAVLDGVYNISMHLRASKVLGADLMIYDSGGYVQRLVIDFATGNLIVFERPPRRVAGDFSIVPTGMRAWPARRPWPTHQWYGGASQTYYTHLAGDHIFDLELNGTPMPATSVHYSSGEDPAFCENITVDAFDKELWTSMSEVCSEADKCRSPNLFKTWRGLQNLILAICQGFVPTGDYSNASAIPLYMPATLFERIGVNFIGRYTAVADSEGHATFTFPPQPIDPHWALLSGELTNSNAGVGGGGGSLSFTDLHVGETYTLVVALGWTRYVPREFRYAYSRSAFIPDIVTDDEGNRSIHIPNGSDPQADFEYPGSWIDRDRSESYKRYEPFGFANDSGIAFEDSVRARYVGDNWGDPGITPNEAAGDDDGALDMVYWRNFWEGKFTKALRGNYQAKKNGFIEYGGDRWFRSRGIDWWLSPIAFGDGEMRTEAGTATGGSSTTLVIAARHWTPDATEEEHDPVAQPDPFWAGDRFVSLMLEVDQALTDEDDGTQTITYRTPITGVSTTESTSTLTFKAVPAYAIPAVLDETGATITAEVSVPALAVVSGNAYRIIEPSYRRNWFKGRKVKVTNPDGANAAVKIEYHDRKTMWLEADLPFTVEPGATWAIQEIAIGGVYIWDEDADGVEVGAWVPPTVNPKALPLAHLLPKNDITFGSVMAGDYLGEHIYQELYAAINELVWTRTSVAWASRDVAHEETPGEYDNQVTVGISGAANLPPNDVDPSGGVDTAYADFLAQYQHKWETFDWSLQEISDAPYYSFHGSLVDFGGIGASERISCAVVSAPVVGMTREIDVYSYAMISDTDPDEGETTVETGTAPNHHIYYANNRFDSHGTPMTFRQWNKWLTVTLPPAQQTYKTAYLGSPVTYIAPTGTPHGQFHIDPNGEGGITIEEGEVFSGFVVKDSHAIVRWNVAGGMTYVAP